MNAQGHLRCASRCTSCHASLPLMSWKFGNTSPRGLLELAEVWLCYSQSWSNERCRLVSVAEPKCQAIIRIMGILRSDNLCEKITISGIIEKLSWFVEMTLDIRERCPCACCIDCLFVNPLILFENGFMLELPYIANEIGLWYSDVALWNVVVSTSIQLDVI